MNADFRRRLAMLEGAGRVDLTDSQAGASPTVAGILATAHFAREAIGRPDESPIDVLARLYGLRNGRSLRPWLECGISDVAELARLDLEPTHGDRWREEWDRRKADTFDMLDIHVGPDWPARLAVQRALNTRTDGFRQPNFSEPN